MPSPSPTLLSDWLGGYPAPSGDVLQGVSRAVGVFREDSEVDADYVIGVIGGDGPIHIDFEVDQAMVRFLVNLVLVSLPPAPAIPDPTMRSDARQTLGFGLGRRKDDPGRRSSWSNLGWVPGLSAGTSRNSTPVPASVAGEGSKEKTRWPSLGLGGLGSGLREAMGSVGTALGLGSSPRTDQAVEPGNQAPTARNVLTPLPPLSNRAGSGLRGSGLKDQVESALEVSEPRGEARDPAQQPSASDNTGNTTHADLASDHVQQSSVALPDLRAAVQADSQADLTWDGRSVWVSSRPSGKDYLKRRLSWIIVRYSSTPGKQADSPFSGITSCCSSSFQNLLAHLGWSPAPAQRSRYTRSSQPYLLPIGHRSTSHARRHRRPVRTRGSTRRMVW